MKKIMLPVTACLLSLLLLLAGCGGSSADKRENLGNIDQDYQAAEIANAPELTADAKSDFTYSLTSSRSEAEEKPADQNVQDGRKLIRTMGFAIETQDFDQSAAKITAMTAALGGYIENSSISGNSYQRSSARTATYVLRIPVSSLGDFNEKIDEIGNVTSRTEKVSDITLTYTDTESRLKSLETQRDTLMDLISRAESLEDLLKIQDHLTNVEYQLENYAAQLRLYDNQVEYSSVSIKLQEVRVYTEPVTTPITFGERISTAFQDGLKSVGSFFKSLVIFLAGSLPSLVILGAVIAAVLIIVRKKVKKAKTKKAAAAAVKTNETVNTPNENGPQA
ncbi:MAG: DUF4349 domain-containing protein [Lachnospiraceae bacterium]|nr:DUF4349 domain-containing protein [Lachnospiraceae bacterium]